jgi:hypothetical protein
VLDPEAFVLRIAKLGDLCADLSPAHGIFAIVAFHQDSIGFSNLQSHLHVAARCVAISCCHGAPLDFIRSEQARPAETLERRRQFPTEVDGIADPGIHPVAPRRDELVRGVACEKDASLAIRFGDQEVRRPRIRYQNLEGEWPAGIGFDEGTWIELGCVLVGKYRNMNSPDIIIVLGNHGSKR